MLADVLSRTLVQSAHAVDVVSSGDDADHALALGIYDLAILDGRGRPYRRRRHGT